MKLAIDFDVPFSECAKCMALDPIVDRRNLHFDKDMNLKCETRFYCKGETFCKSREGIANDGT